jgi:hypothetical protein
LLSCKDKQTDIHVRTHHVVWEVHQSLGARPLHLPHQREDHYRKHHASHKDLKLHIHTCTHCLIGTLRKLHSERVCFKTNVSYI